MDAATLLAFRRTRAGLTQRVLARRAGTSAAAVCLYERGERIPRVDTLARLIAATGASLELSVGPDAAVDRAANGRALEDLLGLADALPKARRDALRAPVFAALAATTR